MSQLEEMEVAALAALLGVGYMLTKGSKNDGSKKDGPEEGFDDVPEQTATYPYSSYTPYPSAASALQTPANAVASNAVASNAVAYPELANGGQPPYLSPQSRTPANQATNPGKPRQPNRMADGSLDLYYTLPSGGSLPANPYTDQDMYSKQLTFADAIVKQAPMTSVTSQVRMNTDGVEAPPVYNSGQTIISPLTGLPMPAADFTHNNMTPYFKGSVKQNMTEDANKQRLDNYMGTGSTVISKREMAPMFEPAREPMGNVNGLESYTDYAQDRLIVPTNRAFERPVEPTKVGPGLDQGFSAFPIGGFQQFEINEIMKQRASVDELRVDSNPKLTFEMPMIPGKSTNDMPTQIGEVRKYHPDKFYLNEGGERNFTNTGENSKPTERPAQVMKFQSRSETSAQFTGPAGAADFSATYTVPSYRAPMTTQHDGFGYRNADGSLYGVRDTDAENNDFGRAGYDLPTNQRNVISERGQGLNVTQANGPKSMTVYDPNDVARTTVRETTGSNDWIGVAGSGSAPTKLTVYDPTDITRVTMRNTMAEPDRALNVTRAGIGASPTLGIQDGVRFTQKGAIAAQSEYTGIGGSANAKAEQLYGAAYNMRQNPTKEVISSGRRPIAGNGGLAIFNGEDNINQSYRKIESDIYNDRDSTSDRVVGPPLGAESLGVQRPRQPLKLDISRDRNIHEILDSLNDNPYALPVYRIAQGIAGTANNEVACAMDTGGYVSIGNRR